jgi:hypothetical protein
MEQHSAPQSGHSRRKKPALHALPCMIPCSIRGTLPEMHPTTHAIPFCQEEKRLVGGSPCPMPNITHMNLRTEISYGFSSGIRMGSRCHHHNRRRQLLCPWPRFHRRTHGAHHRCRHASLLCNNYTICSKHPKNFLFKKLIIAHVIDDVCEHTHRPPRGARAAHLQHALAQRVRFPA